MQRVLLLVATAVTIAAVAWLLRSEGQPGTAERSAVTRAAPAGAADVAGPVPPGATGRTSAARASAELAAPAMPAVRPALDALEPPTTSAPPRGGLRVAGRVVVGDAPLPADVDAVVRVHLGWPAEPRSRYLGATRVRGGAFAYDLPADAAALLARRGGGGTVALVLVAPGFESDIESCDVSEAVDGVVQVVLAAAPGALLVTGRVVDAGGLPVGGAELLVAHFGPIGRFVESSEAVSDTAGFFQQALERPGFFDVVARHPAHGVGRVAARADGDVLSLDLGDVVLEPRGVVAGRVLGHGRAPLAEHVVQLEPLDDDRHDGESTRTADDGTFRFACLDRTTYRVWVDGVDVPEEARPTVTPDVVGLELFAPVPSARVTVVGPDGLPVADATLAVNPVRRLDGTWRIGGPGDADVRPSQRELGVVHVTFSHTGTYCFAAAATLGEELCVAEARVEIGAGHEELRLELAERPRREVSVRVVDPEGIPVDDWSVTFVDAATRLAGGYCGAKRPRVALGLGRWLARVRPGRGTYVQPCDVEVDVTQDSDELLLRAGATGGRLKVRATFLRGDQGRARAQLVDARGGVTGFHLFSDRDVTVPALLAPGAYELVVSDEPQPRGFIGALEVGAGAVPRAPLRRPVTIRAGETVWVQLSVP